ncbi:RNA-binding protein 41 [Caerostris darwini]|uniref:RNA-binding protein 41 n=1 Tax=Caerostris darwini TaxID=1538125 RepID=A0AAV4MU94_9ARAC|nr:RNA-binding protein 41 [Caerostris darwini]
MTYKSSIIKIKGFTMARILNNKRAAAMYLDDDVDVNNLGLETEAEKQMKTILEKQLKTHISIKEQFSQHRSFVSPSTYKSLTELVHGTCSMEKFQEVEKEQELHQELQRCGLSEQEITDYLHFKLEKPTVSHRLVNPSVLQEKISKIEEKILAHDKELLRPQSFKNVKKLTRHEMELESSLYMGCSEKRKLAALVTTEESAEDSYMSGAYSYIKNLSDKIMHNVKRKKKKQKIKQNAISNAASSTRENEDFQFNSNIHHVVVPLDDSEVEKNQLNVEEIKKRPHFGNYSIGEPSKTLYIKNLPNKITADELRSVFGRFEEENGTFIDYRICTGKMRRQAFVKFSNSVIAEKALKFANGFINFAANQRYLRNRIEKHAEEVQVNVMMQ